MGSPLDDYWTTTAKDTLAWTTNFSQVAAVLAGFGFAAIILVVGTAVRRGPTRTGIGHVAGSLLSVVFGMATVCLFFGELAGELGSPTRERVLRLLVLMATVIFMFAVGAAQLFYSIVLLLIVHRLDGTLGLARSIFRWVQVIGITGYLDFLVWIRHGCVSRVEHGWPLFLEVAIPALVLLPAWAIADGTRQGVGSGSQLRRRGLWRARQDFSKWLAGVALQLGVPSWSSLGNLVSWLTVLLTVTGAACFTGLMWDIESLPVSNSHLILLYALGLLLCLFFAGLDLSLASRERPSKKSGIKAMREGYR
jgi:hypothetical protein